MKAKKKKNTVYDRREVVAKVELTHILHSLRSGCTMGDIVDQWTAAASVAGRDAHVYLDVSLDWDESIETTLDATHARPETDEEYNRRIKQYEADIERRKKREDQRKKRQADKAAENELRLIEAAVKTLTSRGYVVENIKDTK